MAVVPVCTFAAFAASAVVSVSGKTPVSVVPLAWAGFWFYCSELQTKGKWIVVE